METEYPFHTFYLIFSLFMVSYRAYYTGFAAAAGETVPKLEEGLAMRRIRYSLGAPFLLGCLLYLINPQWMQWSQWTEMPTMLRWSGVIFLAGSVLLYRWTHEHLGKNFTDTVYVRKKSFLVEDGPYGWIRHPMYLTGILAALGTFFVTANWLLGVVGVTLMVVIMRWRTPIEEQKLIDKYGDAYRNYMTKTGKFLPKF